MRLEQHFIVGRVRRRVLRPPAVDGWLGDEAAGGTPERASLAFKRRDGALSLAPPGADPIELAPDLSGTVRDGDGPSVMIAWPKTIVIVRRGGVVLGAEGDVLHFGRVWLDALHSVERTGFEYLGPEGVEVRVELALGVGHDHRTIMLDPEQSVTLGPYRIEHGHSYDPSDRPGSVRHPAYHLRVRRAGDAPPPPRPAGIPNPLDVDRPAEIVAAARRRGLLERGEALAAEPDELARRLQRYEGPRHNLEEALREAGPTPPRFTRRGDVAVLECARLSRSSHGEAVWGRARIELHPPGVVEIQRTVLGTAPGRLRKDTV